MDIHINDYIRNNITKFACNDNFAESVFGDCLDFPKEKDVAFPEDDFRGFEKLLIQDVVISLYKIILSNPVSLVIALAKTKMVKPETIKGFADNIIRLYAGFETFNKELKDSVEEKRDAFYIVFSNEDNREAYRNYIMFLKTLTPVFQHAVKVEKLCQDKRIDDAEFLKLVTGYNKKISEIFEIAKTKLGDNLFIYGPGFGDVYEQYTSNFNRNCVEVECFRKKIEREEETKVISVENRVVLQSKPNEKEQERLAKIAEVNDLFERFKIDFMRDLEKEVSLMNRDMYEALINKFEKFIKSFSMPLASNVSMGMANEAYGQMNKLYDMFYEISKNTYSPVVFGG